MTVYNVQVGKRTFQVDISGNQVFIDGIKQQARLIQLNASDLFLLCWEQKNRLLHLQPQEGQTYAVTTAGRRVIAQVKDGAGCENQPRLAGSISACQLCAPMPGQLISILVCEGDWVEKGQVLIRQESMKMQMELRAPVTGRVVKVCAQPQARVEKGSLLVEINPDDAGDGKC